MDASNIALIYIQYADLLDNMGRENPVLIQQYFIRSNQIMGYILSTIKQDNNLITKKNIDRKQDIYFTLTEKVLEYSQYTNDRSYN